MRETLIELVGQVQDCGCDVTDVVKMNYVENNVLVDHLIANGVTVQKWIPVTERLPEMGVESLCYDKHGYIFIGTYFGAEYRKGVSCFHDASKGYGRGTTHWMLLPEPPKGE